MNFGRGIVKNKMVFLIIHVLQWRDIVKNFGNFIESHFWRYNFIGFHKCCET